MATWHISGAFILCCALVSPYCLSQQSTAGSPGGAAPGRLETKKSANDLPSTTPHVGSPPRAVTLAMKASGVPPAPQNLKMNPLLTVTIISMDPSIDPALAPSKVQVRVRGSSLNPDHKVTIEATLVGG